MTEYRCKLCDKPMIAEARQNLLQRRHICKQCPEYIAWTNTDEENSLFSELLMIHPFCFRTLYKDSKSEVVGYDPWRIVSEFHFQPLTSQDAKRWVEKLKSYVVFQ